MMEAALATSAAMAPPTTDLRVAVAVETCIFRPPGRSEPYRRRLPLGID